MNRLEQNQETNILIAKFLNMETMQRGSRGWEQCIFSFHHSWYSLMLAIHKITTLEEFQDYEFNSLFWEMFCQLDINDVYTQVVLFIEWYNENK